MDMFEFKSGTELENAFRNYTNVWPQQWDGSVSTEPPHSDEDILFWINSLIEDIRGHGYENSDSAVSIILEEHPDKAIWSPLLESKINSLFLKRVPPYFIAETRRILQDFQQLKTSKAKSFTNYSNAQYNSDSSSLDSALRTINKIFGRHPDLSAEITSAEEIFLNKLRTLLSDKKRYADFISRSMPMPTLPSAYKHYMLVTYIGSGMAHLDPATLKTDIVELVLTVIGIGHSYSTNPTADPRFSEDGSRRYLRNVFAEISGEAWGLVQKQMIHYCQGTSSGKK